MPAGENKLHDPLVMAYVLKGWYMARTPTDEDIHRIVTDLLNWVIRTKTEENTQDSAFMVEIDKQDAEILRLKKQIESQEAEIKRLGGLQRCEVCGKLMMDSKRSTRRTCGNNCRQKLHRQKQKEV